MANLWGPPPMLNQAVHCPSGTHRVHAFSRFRDIASQALKFENTLVFNVTRQMMYVGFNEAVETNV